MAVNSAEAIAHIIADIFSQIDAYLASDFEHFIPHDAYMDDDRVTLAELESEARAEMGLGM